MWRHCNFIKHWLSFRLHHLQLFRSSTGIHSAPLCKHPVLKLTGGQALVWGLRSNTWCQVIPLRFAVLLWINIELFCIRKPCFIFKRFLKLCKQCSQHITRGTTSLAWSAQRPNNCPNQECGPCGCTNFWLPRSFSNIEWLKWHIYSQLQQAISRHY